MKRSGERVAAVIRQVLDTDYSDLARFFEENDLPEITRYFNPFPLNSQTAHQIARNDHLDHYYVATLDAQMVGMFMLRGWEEGFQIPSFGILVDRRYHGMGLGKQITEFAITEASNSGCPGIRLSVYASNTNALSLYASFGFREVSRLPAVVLGQQDEKIIMIKDLNNGRSF